MKNPHQKLPAIIKESQSSPSNGKTNSLLSDNVCASPKSPKKKKKFLHVVREKIEFIFHFFFMSNFLSNSRFLSFRKRLQIFLSWKAFEFFIFILILLYVALVFGTFAIEDPSLSQTITDVSKISFVLKIIEVVILGIFSIEILLKVIAFGFKVFEFF